MSLARVIGSLALAALLAFLPVPTDMTAAARAADVPPDPRSVPAQHGKAHVQRPVIELPTRRPVVVPVRVPVAVPQDAPSADPCD